MRRKCESLLLRVHFIICNCDVTAAHFSVYLHMSLQALPVALRKLGAATNPGLSLPWDTVRDALDHMVQAAASYVDREHFLVLWESLQVRMNTHTHTQSNISINLC